MKETSDQLATRGISRVFGFALGLTIVLIAQQAVGQSAITPSPRAALQAQLELKKREAASITTQIQAEEIQSLQVKKEFEDLKKRESELSLSQDSYPQVLKTLYSQRVQLAIDLAGIGARHDAIEAAIKSEAKKQSDEVLEPYRRIVAVREGRLKRLRDTKDASSKAIQQEEIELLSARVALANASKPTAALSLLNSQLLDTSLERADKTARLEKVNSLHKEVEEYRAFTKLLSANKTKQRGSTIRRANLSNQKEAVDRELADIEKLLKQIE